MKGMKRNRKSEGYALVSIIVIGLFAIMLLLALGGMLVSVAQSEAVSKQKAGLLNAAEIGLEYVLYDIKRANAADESTYDLKDDSPPINVNVPADWLEDSQTVVKARVWKPSSSDLQKVETYSLLWSPQIDPSQASASNFAEPVRSAISDADSEYYHIKVIDVTASRGIFSKSLRVIASPLGGDSSQSLGAATNFINPAANFPAVGVLAISNLSIAPEGGNLTVSDPTNSFDGSGPYRYSLNIQSNKQISIKGGSNSVDIGANVVASNNSNGAPGDFVTTDGNTTIHGRLETNGGDPYSENFVAQNGTQPNSTADNVLADADKVQSGNPDLDRGGDNTVPIATDAGGDSIKVNPVPTSPVGSLSVNGHNTSNQLPSFLNTLSEGNFTDPGTTITMTNGIDSSGNTVSSYVVDSLSIGDSVAKVQIPADISQPVKIYVQGNNFETAVDIDASRFSNLGSPENLQIYYSGPKDVNIKLNSAQFNGLIYAPNAKVNVLNGDTSSVSQSFSGAIVGNEVNVSMRGRMNLLPDPSSAASSGANSDSGSGSGQYLNGLPSKQFTSFKVVSYQEVNGKLVE